MINNRQGGGRRRGRGGQRPQGGMGGGQPGNRQDNRQRGNAAQLLEKYKSLARDSQLAGDRVQTEYYLQYAEHYFRVLGESRARYEEQRRQRGEDLDDEEGEDDVLETADEQQGEPQQRGRDRDYDDRPRRNQRERGDRNDRGDRSRRYGRDEREERDDDERPTRGARNGGGDQSDQDDERIAFDFLPPAIGAVDESVAPEAAAEEAPRPKRRVTRKPKADGDEVAPAA